jgi:fumarate reductase subunit D
MSISDNTINTKTTVLAQRLTLAFSAIGTVFTLGWMLWYSRYGIDFTDESFYLVWLSNPFNYSVSATQFGFIYHPLYELLNGNIAALRQANILITFCLAWVLGNVFLKTVFGNQSLQSTLRLVTSGAIATAALASLVFAGMWLPTPSYNSLALQALLVAAIGLLLADKHASRASIIGWFLLGAGGWLAFMAKPTTAAALGLCISFYLLAAGKFSVRLLVFSLATAVGLLVLSALTIDGSIIAFIDRLKGGAEMYRILGGGHTTDRLLRLDEFQLDGRTKLILITSAAVVFSAAYFSQAKMKALVHCGTLLSITFALASLAIIFGITHQTLQAGQFQCLLLWAIPFAAILLGFSIYQFRGLFQICRPQWVLGLTFLIFPYAYAFGTNANYWVLAANAGIFWVLAGLVFLSPIAPSGKLATLLLPLGLAVQLLTVALVQTGIETPYRQPQPLRNNDYKLEIGKPGSTLVLSKGFGQYFAETIAVAKQTGFKKGTPMIDLTGQSPGILYAMGASNIGQPWTVGGYPGSDALAVAMLRKDTCHELAVAWLLVEIEGPRKISPEILLSFGANIATDFETVGAFKTTEGAGGYKEVRVQQLLKPVRSVGGATTACAISRTAINENGRLLAVPAGR